MGQPGGTSIRQTRKNKAAVAPALNTLDGAEEQQQSAERKQGEAAIPAFKAAAAAFKEALRLAKAQPLPAERHADAYFGLGECLQQLAESLLEACSSQPDDALTPAMEADTRASAKALFAQSVDAYKQVRTSDGQLQSDACVNAANVLAAWAELEQAEGELSKAAELLVAAVEGYERAVQQQEDAATWVNLADTLVKRAEVLQEAGGAHGADQNLSAAYGQAMSAYERACSLSSSEAGDDLPGLLHNWGVGLHSLGTHARDPALAASALEQAAARLREAAAFGRGDPQPLTALGDALAARSECCALGEAPGFLHAALEQGYCAALHLNRCNGNALVGVADVHTALGKLRAAGGDATAAAHHLSEAARHYSLALEDPRELGALRERSDVRYNYACALALGLGCGGVPAERRSDVLHGICSLLVACLASGCTSRSQILEDSDFAPVRNTAELAALLHLPDAPQQHAATPGM